MGSTGPSCRVMANHVVPQMRAQIATPRGSMSGRFFCVTDACEPFDAPVPEFLLALPSALH